MPDHTPHEPGLPPSPVIPLGYGRQDRGTNVGRRLSAEVNERADGLATFAGMLIAAAGGPRRVTLAFGVAYASYGIAMIAARGGEGPGWVGIGAFLIVLVLPVPPRRRRARDAAAAPAASPK
ncbi:MAG: hypothetical protein JWO31_3494 [Phycisphaerales bacterium]|nr:hypothetical protein [Phycisphaerales bacterium]